MSDVVTMAKAELHVRHAFFVDWFTGKASPQAMADCARAFGGDMIRIGPSGGIQNAADITAMVRAAAGRHPADFAITITVQAARLLTPDLALLIYDEHQRIAAVETTRRSTAIFAADKNAPEGVVWRHLQETWIATKAAIQ
jgi:hypothetical protein